MACHPCHINENCNSCITVTCRTREPCGLRMWALGLCFLPPPCRGPLYHMPESPIFPRIVLSTLRTSGVSQ